MVLGPWALGLLLPPVLFAREQSSDRFWPQWRGPHWTGVSRNATPPLEWSESKNIRWKVEIPGRGSARRLSELARVEGLGPGGDYRVTPAVIEGADGPTLLTQNPEGESL